MSVEIVILEKANGGFSIWIDTDEKFCQDSFLTVVEGLEIQKKERVHTSFGPAEYIDAIHTRDGIFSIHVEIDEFAGTTLYSSDNDIMEQIRQLMLGSGQYHVRSKKKRRADSGQLSE